MSIAEELERLSQLRDSGVLDDNEFAAAKAKVLNGTPHIPMGTSLAFAEDIGPEKTDAQTRQWAALLHLSILAGFAFPLAGLAVPVVIWQLKKNDLPGLDAHGKNATNWILSKILYFIVCIPLCAILIGVPLIIALFFAGLIFPIIAAIKAMSGKLWKYPMSITFFK